jgi:acyl-coenzyme A synthetase/AMP-(fatty) acid ligase
MGLPVADVLQFDVPFWHRFQEYGDTIALAGPEANAVRTYGELAAAVHRATSVLHSLAKSVVLLFTENDAGGIIWYLAALRAGHAVFLSPIGLQHPGAKSLVETYCPEFILARCSERPLWLEHSYRSTDNEFDFHVLSRKQIECAPPHPDLALILSTSASSGSPKAVRLSSRNLQASAKQVANALGMYERDRTLLSLPFSYVYGLSVINSSIEVGAAIVLGRGTLADRGNWASVVANTPTILPAVSQTLDFIHQLGMDARSLPTLRGLTHAGEALDQQRFDRAYETFGRNGVGMYLMYGQTEACGRIAVLPPQWLPDRCRSVGKTVADGRVAIGPTGEICYEGPNVMMGYASSRVDLELGRSIDILNTGDTGHLDGDGLLYITGRTSRFCKVSGQRLSLDDVEQFVRLHRPAAAIERDGIVILFIESEVHDAAVTPMSLAARFRLPPQSFRVISVRELPRSPRGKISYLDLRSRT